jgi:hypothetical protein
MGVHSQGAKMLKAIKDIGSIRLFLTGIIVWLMRLLAVFSFLNENGNVPSISPDGRIPANVEYFFSTFIAIVTLATLLGVAYLFNRPTTASPAQQGAAIALGLTLGVALMDILFTVVINGRGFSNWFLNMALDYSPLIFIPLFVGLILQRKSKG